MLGSIPIERLVNEKDSREDGSGAEASFSIAILLTYDE